MVITEDTATDDIIRARNIIKDIDRKIPVILQPVDPVNGINEPTADMLTRLKIESEKELIAVHTMPQCHKIIGIK
jgi:hypothetical protein